MSDKYDSVNGPTQGISELMKLHILGVWQNALGMNSKNLRLFVMRYLKSVILTPRRSLKT